MTREAFVDSGAFIAFLVRRDALHAAAVELFSRPPRRLTTSVLVVAETYGWFVHRLGEDAARTFRAFLGALSPLHVLSSGPAHLEAAFQKLDDLRGVKLTLVDASSLVFIEERRIATVWGTDHHLGLEGATVVPGPPTSGR